MPLIKYWHPTDDTVTNLSLGVGEDEGWWPGIQRLTNIALAATLVAASFSSALAQSTANKQQDDPAGSLYGQYDEDFWQNPVVPVPATFSPAYIPDPEYLPDGFLHGQYDEDFWQNPTPPVIASFGPLYLQDPENIPAGSLIAPLGVDEFYWQNPVSPVQATLGPLYLADPEYLPAGSLYGQPDEDFWINPVAPVLTYNLILQPFSFDSAEIVPQPVVGTQNYVNTGTNNYVSQEIGFGVEF